MLAVCRREGKIYLFKLMAVHEEEIKTTDAGKNRRIDQAYTLFLCGLIACKPSIKPRASFKARFESSIKEIHAPGF